MKRLFLLMFVVGWAIFSYAHGDNNYEKRNMLSGLKAGDKAAILMVHFGTTHDDTRQLTIEALNQKVWELYPQLEIREAYTSRIIIRILSKRGVKKDTPLDALLRLRGEGYTHVLIQSSNIIDGVEMESLRRDVESVAGFFKEVRVGTPLLYSVDDAQQVTEILGNYLMKPENKADKRHHFILVGHGTYTPDTSIYSQLDYMFRAAGKANIHVSTIEGYPTFDTTVAELKAAKAKRVTLFPFMFVAGDHAKNDIAGEWKEKLEAAGFQVDVLLEGLGQIPEIQDIFVEHLRFSIEHRAIGIMEKKAAYAAGKEKN